MVLLASGPKTTVDVAIATGLWAGTTVGAPAPAVTLALPTASTTITAPVAAVASPTPRPQRATPRPLPDTCKTAGVVITSPANDAKLSGQVHVKGTADIANFQYYKVEYRPEGGNWSYLLERRGAVKGAELFVWDTTTVKNGRYSIRLTAVDAAGNYPPPCDLTWTIRN